MIKKIINEVINSFLQTKIIDVSNKHNKEYWVFFWNFVIVKISKNILCYKNYGKENSNTIF